MKVKLTMAALAIACHQVELGWPYAAERVGYAHLSLDPPDK